MNIITTTIANLIKARPEQVEATIRLLDGGDTVPFIARYRKEATGGLDDTQLRTLEERLSYLRELEERRAVIIKSISEQDKLTPSLQAALLNADNKARLEDLYLPFKPKRRTKAQIAIEAGLAPLANQLLQDNSQDPNLLAASFLNQEHNIVDIKSALEGARFILMEIFAEHADLVGRLREYLWENADISSVVVTGKEIEGQKCKDYFSHTERLKSAAAHRFLAMLRGRKEGYLSLQIRLEDEPLLEGMIAKQFSITDNQQAASLWLLETVRWTWKIKLKAQLESELLNRARELADLQSIQVFSNNLRDLLLSPPAGARITLGLDPGLRTGVKMAVVDSTGKLLQHGTIFPHAPRNDWEASLQTLAALCEHYHIDLISIGNGTASRETDNLVSELIQKNPKLSLTKIVVSEAGASVYSASELAALELPELDVSFRGAVSIARRLQDPLAELVKIDPKSIGVGQYQHDVSQLSLARTLNTVVEDCVNAVGVDLNTASVPLLARVAGLNKNLASNIVLVREKNGPFKNRLELQKVPRLGPKAFEQAAGFLRIRQGENPLDASSVHPEAYPLVEKILDKTHKELHEVIGNVAFLKTVTPNAFIDAQYGLPTIQDILKELEKPGRDPRPQFKTANFKKDVNTLADLKPGMILEGVVTNVANFGAFVDIGVHQDGLIHISALADKFISDPRQVIKTNDIVTVKVLEIDIPRKRIALSLRLTDTIPTSPKNNNTSEQFKKPPSKTTSFKQTPARLNSTTLGDALLNALKQKTES